MLKILTMPNIHLSLCAARVHACQCSREVCIPTGILNGRDKANSISVQAKRVAAGHGLIVPDADSRAAEVYILSDVQWQSTCL